MNAHIVNTNPIESRVSEAKRLTTVVRDGEWFNDSQNHLRSLIDLLRNEFGAIAEIEDSRVEKQDAIQGSVDP